MSCQGIFRPTHSLARQVCLWLTAMTLTFGLTNAQEMKYLYSSDELEKGTGQENGSYFKYIDNSTLSSGIYVLKAGHDDPQQPHLQDELYYVMEGRSRFEVRDTSFEVGQGDVIFVPAGDPHRFVQIEEDLKLLVFFSKAETGDR